MKIFRRLDELEIIRQLLRLGFAQGAQDISKEWDLSADFETDRNCGLIAQLLKSTVA